MISNASLISSMKIAFLAGTLGQGGAERQLYYIVKTLINQGCLPDIFVFREGGFWEKPIRDLGSQIIYIEEEHRVQRLRKLLLRAKEEDYQIIHSQQFFTNLYGVALSWMLGARSIGSIRNNVVSEIHGMGMLGWLSLMLPDQIVVNSKLGLENAKKYFRRSNSIFYLPNVVDTDVFYPEKKPKQKEFFKVITVGTVWKSKRIDKVIDIAALVKQQGKDKIIFEIFGDGEDLMEMISLAEKRAVLNSQLFFKGRSTNIATEYRDADLLLLTSDFEGTPNVVMEAMASGLPVIASNVGDIPELVINGETGFSLERNDVHGMANAVIELSENHDLSMYMGQNARGLIERTYTFDRLAEFLTSLYLGTDFL